MNVGMPIASFGVSLCPAHIKSAEEEDGEGTESSTEINCSHDCARIPVLVVMARSNLETATVPLALEAVCGFGSASGIALSGNPDFAN